jgi:hypothetical protein
MAVGVADCFADLAQQVELGGEWDALQMVCEPEVEAAELGTQRVDQADAELGPDQISRPQDAVVVEGLDSAELVLADLPASALVIDRGAGRAHQEPDPRVLLPGHPVVGGPVLPAVALVEGLVVDDPRTGLAAPMRSISRAMISDRLVLMKYRASVSRAPAGVS